MIDRLKRLMDLNHVAFVRVQTASNEDLEAAIFELAESQSDLEDAVMELAEMIGGAE